MALVRLNDYELLLRAIDLEISKAVEAQKKLLDVKVIDASAASLIRARIAGLEQALRVVRSTVEESRKDG